MKLSRRDWLRSTAAAPALARASGAPAAGGVRPRGRIFEGEALREIAFPLGGLGTGTVSLGGYGNLRDWEIFNRPNKGGILPFTFGAMRLSGGGLKRPLIRVLERRPLPPYQGGFGLHREQAVGLPHFSGAVFEGAYPFANIGFQDDQVPAMVSLEAFNPMIPLDTANSSLPAAVLTYRLVSKAPAPLDVTVAFSAINPVGYDGKSLLSGTLADRNRPFFGANVNEYRRDGDIHGLLFSSRKYQPDSPRHGSFALATRGGDISYRLTWEQGDWWDDFHLWYDEFLTAGRFLGGSPAPSPDGLTNYATLASHFTLDPGQSRSVNFVLSWHFPVVENYDPAALPHARTMRNWYGGRWPSAWEPAAYLMRNLDTLRDRSLRYRDALHGSTLPPSVIDAVSSQASIMRTNTVMVGEGKVVFAFEGCADHEGSCPMNCTHVYNYEQSLAHLYPDLERSMRELDFLMNMRADGSMSFRTPVPPVPGGNRNHPAADGQMGCVLKVYREWRICGDDAWLRRLWPEVKRALEYAWVKWDADRDGVMEGEQHNTYDINFYGPNSMMGTLYLGALAAASRMAAHLGEAETARSYDELRAAGAAKLDRLLWNGEYFVQKVDESAPAARKYQYGDGCLSDQLLGQWFAEVVGLGRLLPREHIRAALASVFRHNFRNGFEGFPNLQRIFATGDESGLLLCSWPRGKRPPLPFVYCDEVWTGIEYQVAAHLIYEGMVKEGVAIVDAVRARYDGVKRNPWNEIELGHHYARAMSSWSLLTAYSGFSYSAPSRELSFHPRQPRGVFRTLFTAGSAWGVYSHDFTLKGLRAELRVEEGDLEIATLSLPFQGSLARVECRAPHSAVRDSEGLRVAFRPLCTLPGGSTLTLAAYPE
ncbi:MAG: hypothetical protein IH602_16700 [Bryobacteraceae bacterium]|nr:hypothetical protein [Bryobacteraceae bacterium]